MLAVIASGDPACAAPTIGYSTPGPPRRLAARAATASGKLSASVATAAGAVGVVVGDMVGVTAIAVGGLVGAGLVRASLVGVTVGSNDRAPRLDVGLGVGVVVGSKDWRRIVAVAVGVVLSTKKAAIQVSSSTRYQSPAVLASTIVTVAPAAS